MLSSVFHAQAQHSELDKLERAYLYHTIKKSPILDDHLGRFIEYRGEVKKYANGNIDFDRVEADIIENPNLLFIHQHELRKSNRGILIEAVNKVAIWELNKLLMAKRINDSTFRLFDSKYKHFEGLLLKGLPTFAKDSTGKHLHPRMLNVLNPMLTIEDKSAQLNAFRTSTPESTWQIIQKIQQATSTYIELRSKELFENLGISMDAFQNFVLAAGDGIVDGDIVGRVEDEKGDWSSKLPRPIGMFMYDTYLTKATKKEVPKVETYRNHVLELKTVGNNRKTALHFDVWGYEKLKQTTVVIEKDGKNYHLFGMTDSRFLSPDSAFEGGQTYQQIIHELNGKIAAINEQIFGKRGFNYWIDHNTKLKQDTELKIIKNEKSYSDLGYKPITTSDKPSHKVKKSKKKAVKTGSGDDWYGDPTTYANKKTKGDKQNDIVYLYGLFEHYKAEIKKLEKLKAEAIDLRDKYQVHLDQYQQALGYKWIAYKEVEDGLYVFEDSSTFDFYKQEFTFPASEKVTDFEVKLLSIPQKALSNKSNEVMLHLSLYDAPKNYDARVQLFVDSYVENQIKFNQKIISKTDSLSLSLLVESLLQKKKEIVVNAQVSVQNEAKSSVLIDLSRKTLLQFFSTTRIGENANQELSDKQLQAKNNYKLSDEQCLAILRLKFLIDQFQESLRQFLTETKSATEGAKITKKLHKIIQKSSVVVGEIEIKLSKFD